MSKLNKVSLISIFLGSCFYVLSYYYIDQPLAYYFHSLSFNTIVYTALQFFSFIADGKVCALFIVASFIVAMLVLFKHPQNKAANNLLFIGIAMIAVFFVDTSLKYLLGRYRPELLFQQGLYGFHYFSHQFLMNSSPSGHASRFFVFVTGLSFIWKRGTPLFLLVGLLVCWSRLALGFHFLSDVIFGSLLGFLITLWIAQVYYSLTISNISFKSRSTPRRMGTF